MLLTKYFPTFHKKKLFCVSYYSLFEIIYPFVNGSKYSVFNKNEILYQVK